MRSELHTLLFLVCAALLTACGGGGGSVTPGPGTSDFRAVTSIPDDGAQNVALDTTVRVTFSDEIDPDSVVASSLRVGVVGSGEIPGTTSIFDDGAGRTLVWNGTSSLFPVATHAVQINGGLQSTAGARVVGGLQFTFRTGGGLPPVPLPTPSQLRPTAGKLNIGRRSHTATLLTNGRVLVAGGFSQGTSVTDRAETYANDLFSLVAQPMHQARAGHTATRLANGKVLLAGGWYEASLGQLATTARAELYDPATGTFAEVGDMNVDRVDHAAILLPDGTVLLTGGSRLEAGFLEDLDSAELFDPATGEFTLTRAPMVHTHATHVMGDLGIGKIALVGGSDTDNRPETYDLATGEFATLSPAASDAARFGAMGASFASGSLCVAGGEDRGTVLYLDNRVIQLLNTGSGLSKARAYGTATRIATDRILVAGGQDLDRPGFFMLHTTDLVVEGGIGGSRTFGTEMSFPVPMALHTATRLGNGTVLFCGGLNENSGEPERDEAFLFTP